MLPASQPFAGRSRRVLQHMRCCAELFRRVIEVYKTLEVVSEFGREAFLQQIPHLRGAVAAGRDSHWQTGVAGVRYRLAAPSVRVDLAIGAAAASTVVAGIALTGANLQMALILDIDLKLREQPSVADEVSIL